METTESKADDIGTGNKVNGDESNAEPVDANETVMDSNAQDTINETDADNNLKGGVKRKADDSVSEIAEKIPKIDNVEKSLKNGEDEGDEDSSSSDENDQDQDLPTEPAQTEDKETTQTGNVTHEKLNDTSRRKSEDSVTKQDISTTLSEEKSDTESPKQKTLKSPPTPTEATRQSVRANRNSNPAAFLVKKPKLPTDMSNPAYKEPFKYGWRRELVYRANSESGPKRNGDIYYFTPDGKKVRSMREVLENLKNKELSTENFTFYKEPLGMNNPELEIIRVAKVKGVPSTTPNIGFSATKKIAKKEQKVLDKSLLTKSKSPKFANALKVKFSGARLTQGKRSLSNSSKGDRKSKSSKTQLQIGTLPPGWQSPSKKNSEKLQGGTLDKVKLTEQCSIRCKGVDPVVPTLQCSLCLCLYHPECVGLTPLHNDVQEHYVCKNCQPEEESFKDGETTEADTSLPPLTPFSAIKAHAPISTIPPRLHKINNAENSRESFKKNPRTSKLLNSSRHLKLNDANHSGNSRPETSKSIVGSVTTWLQPSSQIQMIQSNNESIASLTSNTESAQSQATIGGRKFIIIPKQNLLSIHPNEQTSVVPPSENAQTPTTLNSLDNPPIPSATDKMSDTATSLGPLTYNSEVITITTNNAHSQQTSQSVVPLEPPLPESPSPVDIHSRLLWQKDGPQLKQSTSNIQVPEKLSARSKRHSQRVSSTSTQSSTDNKSEKPKDTGEKEQFMQNFLSNVSVGYTVLFQVFQYLKVQELLRASRVCRMWRDIASHSSLWRVVRMKNSQVRDWKGLATSLKRHGTETLDLRKMLIPGNGEDMWTTFSNEVGNANSLRKVDLCRCPATVVEQLANSNCHLEIINAISIRCTTIDLSSFTKLQNLRELRLKSQTGGINLTEDFSSLEHLTKLRHLSLLSFKDLGKKNIEKIASLIELESLELGECDSLSETFGTDVLSKFEKIEKLRLEKGPSGTSTYNILESISKLTKLHQIELVNFDVKPGFDEALALCTNIKRLLLIPTYITQSATTNNMVLNGIFQLSGSLTHFIWGVTLELLRVTELFIDQCDQTPKKKAPPKKDKKGSGDSIPILKPVPFVEDFKGVSDNVQDNTQVEILPIQALQKLLTNKLQDTKVKILKIPFHATWRQSINDVIQ